MSYADDVVFESFLSQEIFQYARPSRKLIERLQAPRGYLMQWAGNVRRADSNPYWQPGTIGSNATAIFAAEPGIGLTGDHTEGDPRTGYSQARGADDISSAGRIPEICHNSHHSSPRLDLRLTSDSRESRPGTPLAASRSDISHTVIMEGVPFTFKDHRSYQSQPIARSSTPIEDGKNAASSFLVHAGVPTGPSAGMQYDFEGITQRIWRFNDQRASLFLQERLKAAIPGEYGLLVGAIMRNVTKLMTHRFGNFLVQCMVQVATPQDLDDFSSQLNGRMAKYSMDPFCCHVIQKLLDVSPPDTHLCIAFELLASVVPTMINPSGSHVWQKLLHLPWSCEHPPITLLVHNGVHEFSDQGWLAVIQTHAGCAAIKSFLGVSTAGNERQECLDELLAKLEMLMEHPCANALVVRLAMISSSRARTLAHILSRAYEYSIDSNASTVLISLLHRKIPGLATRLHNALLCFHKELSANSSGRRVLQALEAVQNPDPIAKRPSIA